MARTGLLDTLGLSAPIAANKGKAPPVGGSGPTGPLRKPGDVPRDEIAAPRAPDKPPRPGKLDDDALAKALKSLPSAPVKRAEVLADLVTKVSDTARRDPIVRALRDTIAKIQPLMSQADAKKKIDEAIAKLVEKGAKDALMALLKAAVGKAPTKVDRDAPRKDGPNLREKDLGERILKTPELPLPIDKPPPVKVLRFRIEGIARAYKAGQGIDFALTTPDYFKPDDAKLGAARVEISTKEDFDKHQGRPTVGNGRHITQRGRQKLWLPAPMEPGRYAIFVRQGTGIEDSSVEEFEVR